MTKPNSTEIVFVVDRSGSMQSIAADMRGGFDAFIAKQKETPGECKVTLTQFDGPREQAMRMGLVEVVQKTQKPRQGEVALPWNKYVNPSDQRHSWTDICKVISKSDFLEMYTDCFNPILTYAALDDEGWQAPGEMGWFGMSSDQSEDYIAFKKEFVQRVIKSAKPDDVLVCVDCHI